MHFTLPLAALMYVLTGGPSVGKTSIIKELESQGEATIREAATDWIAGRLQEGIVEFWKEENFEYNIQQLQLEREKPFLSLSGRVFVDRGIFDPFSYVPLLSLAGTKELSSMNAAVAGIDLNERYAAIFLILPYQADNFSPAHDEIRHENEKEFYEIHSALYATYCRHKHFIVVPGGLSPKERADFILKTIDKIESSKDS